MTTFFFTQVTNMADNLSNEVREHNRVNLGLPNAPKVMQLSKSTKHALVNAMLSNSMWQI